jgi:saccharopine dehydrogenase-like NADP-dependent oxidoreductase
MPHCLRYFDNEQRAAAISKADIVISMLQLTCTSRWQEIVLSIKKFNRVIHSDAMQELDAAKRTTVFMNEIGLDPGIDHMSAMK